MTSIFKIEPIYSRGQKNKSIILAKVDEKYKVYFEQKIFRRKGVVEEFDNFEDAQKRYIELCIKKKIRRKK